jgi:ubiquinone/menaquinone biosynthesis C-methylase UbiE
MSLYGNYLLPRLIDLAMRHPIARERRQALVPMVTGTVLDVGIGSGLNLAYYSEAAERIVGIDPSEPLLGMAKKSAARSPAALVCASAERLPFADGSFDSIVLTWTLCSIADPQAALAEFRRLLKPRGRLFFVEHGLAPDERVRRWQHRLTPLWSRLAGGCHLDRPMDRLIESAGFQLEHLEARYVSGPRLLAYFYEGRARSAP